ncbi:MAG TPA: L,D-transpeptidase [Thermoanaerobaculia bacterium]
MKRTLLIMALAVLAGCSKEVVQQKTQVVADKMKGAADDITAPIGGRRTQAVDKAAREKERFDQRWRELQSFRAQQAQQVTTAVAAPPTPPPANFAFVTGVKQSFKHLDPKGINDAPVLMPISGDLRGPSVLRAQVYLDRSHFSVGSIDGRWGRNSAITVWWYQRARGLPTTGDVDEQTFRRLASDAAYAPVVVSHTLTADDVKGPFKPVPDDVYEKAKQDCLCYESLREKLSERFHSTEDFLELLNPDVKFSDLQAGSAINVPNVREPMTSDHPDIARVVISISGNSLNGFDVANNLIFHAPTTLGAGYDPSPTETLHVVSITPNPSFHYDPTLYHEVPDSEPDAQLPSGPNTPVGVVWMALSKPHYGVHGTPDPDSIGYASSHGCVRLTNWDAQEAEHRLSKGTQISFVDTRSQGMPEVAKKD